MSERTLVERGHAIDGELAALRAALPTGHGQELFEVLVVLQKVVRRAEHAMLAAIAHLDRDGAFADRGVRAAPAIADLLGCRETEARRLVELARAVFPTALDGSRLQPRLPAVAAALGRCEIGRAHAQVIERALASGTAERIGPDRRVGLEQQLVELARHHRPDQLTTLADRLLDALDQDGPEPAPDHPQPNELHLAPCPGGGGRLKARLDASTFEVLTRALTALTLAGAGARKTLGERRADALGELCEHALDQGRLPVAGGEPPHVTLILDWQQLRAARRGIMLDHGGRASAAQLRSLLCDAKITPVVFGGRSQPSMWAANAAV